MNQYETRLLEEQFLKAGFELVDAEDMADVYVLNSCTVTGEADKKCRQQLRRFRRQNPSAVIALCGCFPQAFPEEAEHLPDADILLGTANKKDLLAAVQHKLAGDGRIVELHSYTGEEVFTKSAIGSFGERTRAFLKIQDGCERYCAYCIIPHARGPVRSKPLEELRAEVTALSQNGYLEIVLVGINLSCYGQDMGLHLADAVEVACSVEGIQRVRLGSLEPELLDTKTIERLAGYSKLCPQFHLSLQSGSDATLARMNRHYTTAEYTKIVTDLRQVFSGAAITTDSMVGFPGETEQEFGESLDFVRQIGFARVHVFAYSRRPGTVADQMPNQISGEEKVKRSKQMIAVTNQTRLDFLAKQLGGIQPVLFETGKHQTMWEGYTPNYCTVHIASDKYLHGQIRDVKILEIQEDNLFGELV